MPPSLPSVGPRVPVWCRQADAAVLEKEPCVPSDVLAHCLGPPQRPTTGTQGVPLARCNVLLFFFRVPVRSPGEFFSVRAEADMELMRSLVLLRDSIA